MFFGGQKSNLIQAFYKYIIHFTGANLFINCALTCQLIRKGATAEAYVSIRNRNVKIVKQNCKTKKKKCKLKKQSNYGPKLGRQRKENHDKKYYHNDFLAKCLYHEFT